MRLRPLVSIVTPCYNGENFVKKYFESILGQTYSSIELIFVNDGSTDNTERIAVEFEDHFSKRGIRYIHLFQKNGGQANALNNGLQYIKGEYLIWPDSDDLLDPDSIEKRVDVLEQHSEYGFVRSNGDFFDFNAGQRLYRISDSDNRFTEDIFMDLILETTYCCCGCYMIRSQLFYDLFPAGRIMESSAGQNWQLLIPIAGRHKCGYIEEDLYHIACREDSHSRQQRTLEEQLKRYQDLKDILIEGIRLSGRTDEDYSVIVERKYLRLNFRCCFEYGDISRGKKYFQQLKQTGKIDRDDLQVYLQKTNTFEYKLFYAYLLLIRAFKKAGRILSKRKKRIGVC